VISNVGVVVGVEAFEHMAAGLLSCMYVSAVACRATQEKMSAEVAGLQVGSCF
jgi:hypothetical protein